MDELESSYNTGFSSNNQFFNSANALQIRLDTQSVIENLEMFLKGTIMIYGKDEDGNLVTREQCKGKKRANDEGIQSILAYLSSKLNTQIVQGNFAADSAGYSEQYESYMYHLRTSFTYQVVLNAYNWEIADEDLEYIIDVVMDALEPFLTRLIGNKERESYTDTIRHVESNTTRDTQGKQGIKLFG